MNIAKDKPCPISGAHGGKCVCKGTKWVTLCESCEGAGFNGKTQKVCGTCAGHGVVMSLSPKKEGK